MRSENHSEKKSNINKQKRLKRALIIQIVIIAAVSFGMAIYLLNYYHADEKAQAYLSSDYIPESTDTEADGYQDITIDTSTQGQITFIPDDPQAGLIFYPGGKVEYTAYAPLMNTLAHKGVLCVLLKMTGNLAVLSPNKANGVEEEWPGISNWYIGGHSLGGVIAAQYAAGHSGDFDGLILLAAYAKDDLSQTDLNVLSIYGSNDGVLKRDKYKEALSNLPEDFTEIVIDGGCHAYFGSYGAQKGDGTPTITPEEQWNITADAICEFAGISGQ